MVTTVFPGADGPRVESLVSERLEDSLQEIDEIKELRTVSQRGISILTIELRDDVYEVDTVWSRIRDKIGDASGELPPGAMEPRFEQLEVKAYALIVSLSWDASTAEHGEPQQANYAILRRLAEQLDDRLASISGTEEVNTFGDPKEEVLVEIDASKLAMIGMSASDVSRQIQSSDAKFTAGQLRGEDDFLLEVSGELATLSQLGVSPFSRVRTVVS